MYLRGVRVGDLKSEHLLQLLEQKVQESSTLDYKRDYMLAGDESRRELLADVSAMANTQGGVLLFGIEEERDADGKPTGIPLEAVGIELGNEDSLRLALLSCIQDGLSPRVRGVHAQIIDVNGRSLLALGIPRSLEAPHAVWFKQNGKFYRRRDTGKYQVDIAELRAMFNERETWEDAADEFRRGRIERIRRNEVVPIAKDQFVALHVLPLGRLRQRVDLIGDTKNPHERLGNFVPGGDWLTGGARGVLEGLLMQSTSSYPTDTFVLMFNSGAVEYVTTTIQGEQLGEKNAFIMGHVVDLLTRYCPSVVSAITSQLLVEPPFAVYLTIIGAANATIFRHARPTLAMRNSFLQNELLFPAIVVNGSSPTERDFEPLVRMAWQAAGALK